MAAVSKNIILHCLIIVTILPTQSWACTIFCAKDQQGQMWAGNNEDYYFFSFSNWIKIVPKTDSTLSYMYFGYPETEFPQGGINEALIGVGGIICFFIFLRIKKQQPAKNQSNGWL